MEFISERLFHYRDKLRRQKRKTWWERAKPFIELSLSILIVILLILAGIYYFYYQSLYNI